MGRRPLPGDVPGVYRALIAVGRPLLVALTRRRWAGAEHLPAEGGFLVVSNHLSYIDPFTLAHYLIDHGHPPHYLGKASIFELPVIGRLVAAAGQIPVHRGTTRASESLAAAMSAVRAGLCVVVMPEGTLTKDPRLWPMTGRTGAARIALETRRPVVPVAQWGPEAMWPPNAKWPSSLLARRTMHITAGAPVDLDDLYGDPLDAATLRAATERMMAAVTALLEDLRAEQAPAERYDPRDHPGGRAADPHTIAASQLARTDES